MVVRRDWDLGFWIFDLGYMVYGFGVGNGDGTVRVAMASVATMQPPQLLL